MMRGWKLVQQEETKLSSLLGTKTETTCPITRLTGSWSGKTKLAHAHCRNSARGDCETLVQRGIDLRKERREGAQ